MVGALFVLFACANPYRLNYVSVMERFPSIPAFAPSTDTPRLMESKNPQEDVLRVVEDGFIPIGFSTFNSVKADKKLALAHARKIGADVVMTSHQQTHIKNELVPQPVYQSPESVRIDKHGSVWDGKKGVNYNDSKTVTYEGHYETGLVNQETAFYDQKAVYFRKLKKPIFGAFVSPLPEETRSALGRNRGVIVRAVMTGSPAFRADVLKGDILIGIEGKDIVDPDEFYKRIDTLAGRSVSLSVLRNGQPLELSLKLGKRSAALAPKQK